MQSVTNPDVGCNPDFEAAVDNCSKEPVHIPGRIQPFGAMLICDGSSLEITDVSANTRDYLNLESTQLIAQSIDTVLGDTVAQRLKQVWESENAQRHRQSIGIANLAEQSLSLNAFRTEQSLVVEIEPIARTEQINSRSSFANCTRELVEALRDQTTLEGLLDKAVHSLRDLTQYDRVVVVRFDATFNGEVLAESRNSSLESLNGLHFPEFDIPAQARDIMRRLPLRLISDSKQEPVAIIPNSRDFDISISELRGVSPVHMTYLDNMSVQATMTLAIVLAGELWGYFSFHNKKAYVPTNECRDICRATLDFFISRLENLQHQRRLQNIQKFKTIATNLYQELGEDVSLSEAVKSKAPQLLEYFDAQGIGLVIDGVMVSIGETLPELACATLLNSLDFTESERVIGLDCLSEQSALELSELGDIAGALVIQMFDDDALFIFRKAIVTQIKWAGAPEKIITNTKGIARLHPRSSFSEYVEEYKNKSRTWSEDDIANAELMVEVNVRVGLERQAVLNIQKLNDELARSNSELDNFAYIASHDLKEPLRGVAINADFLLRENLDDKAQKRVLRINELCNRSEQLIADLLYFSRLGRGDDAKRTVDVKVVIDEIQHSLIETLELRNGTIILATELPRVYAERSKIMTIFHNLIVNALKYNNEDQKTIEIGFTSSVQVHTGSLSGAYYVKDNGIGIDHEHHNKIFRIFTRLNNEKAYGPGTGAGLAFVKKVVNGYGGEITYHCDESGGTTFYFSLPLAKNSTTKTISFKKAA